MLSFQSYTKAIDLWSVGCILAELLGGRPFFKGRDYVDQLNQILHVLGTPPETTMARIGSRRAQDYVRSLPYQEKVPFANIFPHANPLAIDLLDKLLQFDPHDRIDVATALDHPYLAVWHDPAEEPLCPTTFDFAFEQVDDLETMRGMIWQEVCNFRALVRNLPPPPPQQQQLDNNEPNEGTMPTTGVGITRGNAIASSTVTPTAITAAGRMGSTPDEEPMPLADTAMHGGAQEDAVELEAVLAGGLDAKSR